MVFNCEFILQFWINFSEKSRLFDASRGSEYCLVVFTRLNSDCICDCRICSQKMAHRLFQQQCWHWHLQELWPYVSRNFHLFVHCARFVFIKHIKSICLTWFFILTLNYFVLYSNSMAFYIGCLFIVEINERGCPSKCYVWRLNPEYQTERKTTSIKSKNMTKYR